MAFPYHTVPLDLSLRISEGTSRRDYKRSTDHWVPWEFTKPVPMLLLYSRSLQSYSFLDHNTLICIFRLERCRSEIRESTGIFKQDFPVSSSGSSNEWLMSVFAGAEESLHQYSARSSAWCATDKGQLVPSSSRPRMNICQGLGRLIKSERSPKHTTARDCRDMYMERKSKNTRLTWGKNVTSLGYNNCIFLPWQANFSMTKLSLPISHHQKKNYYKDSLQFMLLSLILA